MKLIRSLFRLMWLLVFLVAVLILILSNQMPVTFSLHPLPLNFEVPLYVVGVGCLIVGMLFSALVLFWRYVIKSTCQKMTAHKQNKKIQALENEIQAIRTQQRATEGAQLIAATHPPSLHT